MTNRNLDITVARLRGLDVLGEAPCWSHSEGWSVDYFGNSKIKHLVYLKTCFCKDEPDYDGAIYFKHTSHCLEVVPFYHQDHNLAIEALEQVCDARGLTVMSKYKAGKWLYSLWDQNYIQVTEVENESLALAICRALGELERENV